MINGSDLMGAFFSGSNSLALVIFYVALVIGQWKVFEKAGEEGWKSLIPFYNAYILWKIAGRNFWEPFFTTVVIFLVALLLFWMTVLTEIYLVWLSIILCIAGCIYPFIAYGRFCNELSEAFGHKQLFALGLFIMQPIFLMILGFNKDKYTKVEKADKNGAVSENQQ